MELHITWINFKVIWGTEIKQTLKPNAEVH